jgi:universal stress protein A
MLAVIGPNVADGNGHVARAEEYLRARRDDMAEEGLTVNIEVASGPPPECILDRATAAELTVMTYGTKHWLFGGALDFMLQNMTRPLVVVRASSSQTRPAFDTPKVLVPLDTAPYSTHALPEAQRLAKALGASIVLCHVIDPVGPYLDAAKAPPGMARIIDDRMEKARSFLSDVAAKAERGGATVETVVAMGEAPQQIIGIAEQSQAGLIAMATRGTHNLSRLMGSVAYGVLQFGRVPALLVRPNGTS